MTTEQKDNVEKLRLEVERGIRTISTTPPITTTPAEAIADQAVALLKRANAHIRESFDAMQKKLDDLKRTQDEHMARAEASIRAAMAWNDYMSESMSQLDSGIETARGDLAQLTTTERKK